MYPHRQSFTRGNSQISGYRSDFLNQIYKQGVFHTVALPFTLKKDLKAKEELWNLKYFTMQKYNLPKII
jgi:hypothetical protein